MRVLVVEDDSTWAGQLGALLSDGGWEVDRVESAEQGLRHLEAGPLPALILLDLVLPKMDGWTFYRHLRTTDAWSKIPVMVLTQSQLPDIPLRGIVAFLQKRGDRNQVLADVSSRIEGWRAEQATVSSAPFRVVVPDDMQRMIAAFPASVESEITNSLQNAAQMVAHELPLTSTWLQAVTAGDEPTLVVKVDAYRVMIQLQPDLRTITVIAVLSPDLGWRGLG